MKMKARHKVIDKKYDAYVEHPRYGRGPRFTSLNPNPYNSAVQLHWNATSIPEIQKRARRIIGKEIPFLRSWENTEIKEPPRIPGTALEADVSRQNYRTMPVTHYFDLDKICRKCHRPFIFFAEEQKHWYEELGFPLEADCVRCPACRKQERFLAKNRQNYERLAKDGSRDWKDNLKMAGCALTLVEHGVFGNRVVQTIRRLLKSIPEDERNRSNYQDLIARLKQLGESSTT